MANSRRNKRGKDKEDDRPVIWVGYGKLLKLFRERANVTQQALAVAIGYSLEQTASVEQGRRPAKSAFTDAAERFLDAGGALAVLQDDVDRAKLPAFFQDFALIETEAVSRFAYDPLLVPGLLQTEEYIRALFAGHCPPLHEEIVEQHTEARLSRQKILTRTPLVEVSFVIEDAALTNPVGEPELMRRQMRHLLEVGATRNVEIQVMPSGRGFHPGLNGGFVLVESVEHQHVGYVESQETGIVVSDPAMASALSLRYGKLRSQALNAEESARRIEHLAGVA